jgi:uncharacterized membrane protein
MKKILAAKLDGLTTTDVVKLISWIVAFGAAILVTAAVAYVFWFGDQGASNSQAVWGQFGDFIGGTVNPALSFLSLLALCLTIILQNRQLSLSARELELSRRELELTRAELARSTVAQEQSERSLRAQAQASEQSAKLATLNFLLDHYQKKLSEVSRFSQPLTDPDGEKKKEIARRHRRLLDLLDSFYDDITRDTNQ